MDHVIAFTVIYRWQLHDDKTRQFQDAWETVTKRLMKDYEALGSRLHVAEDGTWVAYAQWPSKEAWQAARRTRPCDPPAAEAMRDATLRSFEPILLEPVCDHLLPGRVPGAGS